LRRTHDTERYYSDGELLIASFNTTFRSSQAAFACAASQIEPKTFQAENIFSFLISRFCKCGFSKNSSLTKENNLRVTLDLTSRHGVPYLRIVTLYVPDFVV